MILYLLQLICWRRSQRQGHGQERRHEVLFRGGRIHGHPNPPIPKFIFSSDFGHFILKMFNYAKKLYVSRKKLLKYHNLGGRPPLISRLRGTRLPAPPPHAFGAHGHGVKTGLEQRNLDQKGLSRTCNTMPDFDNALGYLSKRRFWVRD